MAGENRGLYVFLGGTLVPAATVKGSKGDPGEKGDPGVGVPGASASGVIVKDTAPPNPTPWETVWMDVGGLSMPPAWTTPTFINSWVSASGATAAASYRKDADGYVWMKGLVSGGTSGNAIFNLPVGFRPSATLVFATSANNLFGQITVQADGNVFSPVGAGSRSLDTVRFLAEG